MKNTAIKLFDDENVNIPVYPAFSNTPAIIQSRNPLNTIAETSPEVFAEISNNLLKNEIASERNGTIRAISSDNKDIACTWLSRRSPEEKRIKIGTAGGVKSRSWFGKGEETALTTVIEID